MSRFYENVPDDWGSYYTHCDLCGERYHLSEGGCGCTDDLDDCGCGKNEWEKDRDGNIRCAACHTEPGAEPIEDEVVMNLEYTGYDQGDLFRSEVEVREYFSATNFADMFPGEPVPDQAEFNEMIETVLSRKLHCDF